LYSWEDNSTQLGITQTKLTRLALEAGLLNEHRKLTPMALDEGLLV